LNEPTRRQRWLPYLRDVADRLHLRDWRFVIAEDLPNDRDSIATAWCCYGRKYATLRLNDSFLADNRDEQRNTIVHELVHAHLAPYVRAVETMTNDDKVLRLLMEYSVDGLANAIAPLVPLPPTIK
jgi:hypothetical protein